jgi:hypothetical protein
VISIDDNDFYSDIVIEKSNYYKSIKEDHIQYKMKDKYKKKYLKYKQKYLQYRK